MSSGKHIKGRIQEHKRKKGGGDRKIRFWSKYEERMSSCAAIYSPPSFMFALSNPLLALTALFWSTGPPTYHPRGKNQTTLFGPQPRFINFIWLDLCNPVRKDLSPNWLNQNRSRQIRQMEKAARKHGKPTGKRSPFGDIA